ncbi:MAG: hypothetical protein FWD17_05625 [Polyangiaceae bacterium]|nr:hypothetical protein [Polyangiaceae bacterium]
MSDPSVPIDYELRRALGDDAHAPPAVRERVRARLRATLGVPLDGADGGDRAPRPAPGATRVSPLSGPVAGAFVAGGITGAALFGMIAGRPPPQVIRVTVPVPVASTDIQGRLPPVAAVPSPPPPRPDTVPSPPALLNPAPVVPPPAAIRHPDPPGSSHVPRFSAERRLLDEARAALVQGDPGRALASLDEHRARFPDGDLAEARDAMAIQAWVGAARYDEARAGAAAFRARWPRSFFLDAVDSAIASIR